MTGVTQLIPRFLVLIYSKICVQGMNFVGEINKLPEKEKLNQRQDGGGEGRAGPFAHLRNATVPPPKKRTLALGQGRHSRG